MEAFFLQLRCSDKTEHGSHTYSHAPDWLTDWLGSGPNPKEISRGTLETRPYITLYVCVCVNLLTPAFWDRRRRPDAQRVRRREELWKRMCQRRGKQSRRVLFEGVGWQRRGAAVEGRGGTVFLFPCLAQLGLVRLQASMGEPSLFPRRCQLPVVVQLHVQLCSGACLSLPMPPSKTLLASPWCGF